MKKGEKVTKILTWWNPPNYLDDTNMEQKKIDTNLEQKKVKYPPLEEIGKTYYREDI